MSDLKNRRSKTAKRVRAPVRSKRSARDDEYEQRELRFRALPGALQRCIEKRMPPEEWMLEAALCLMYLAEKCWITPGRFGTLSARRKLISVHLMRWAVVIHLRQSGVQTLDDAYWQASADLAGTASSGGVETIKRSYQKMRRHSCVAQIRELGGDKLVHDVVRMAYEARHEHRIYIPHLGLWVGKG